MARTRAVVVAILAAASLGGWWAGRRDAAELDKSPTATVVHVLDGDTIRVVHGGHETTIRLLGVDTPETHHPTKPVGCFGPEAAAYTERRLAGRRVELVTDLEVHDRYGRTLAFVYLDGNSFNDELLRLGYARLLVIPPNGAHARTQLAIELAAKAARRGLWGECEP